ncbi:winged helix-turn-helix domain-containing protein [Paenibacillus sp. MMS20-IR301]|uniref:winged helix-turn-helix domain-containing protein n=1 Tax=Paenibacillus sp. MMS20-IR301 TaxID=2895946 RepID=UPI0028EB1D38|nr:winged helix-turn-helix domain-containing protein [Paenibacillus sp. MMS20-IR301]WNS45305.1 winged helix-turn-helix domain-containing protein [Paenibacillus sp. MMS20-IR301]
MNNLPAVTGGPASRGQNSVRFAEPELHHELYSITVALEERIGATGSEAVIEHSHALEELLRRMRSLLGKVGALPESSLLVVRDIVLDPDGWLLMKGEEPISLTKREFEIFAALLKNKGRVMTRELLLESVWGYDSEVDIKAVDVYISYLRSKIDAAGQPSIIQTVRGLGYVIRN